MSVKNNGEPPSAILLISCPDQKGLIAEITKFIFEHDGNILDLDQHVDQEENVFFQRVQWSLEGFKLAPEEIGPKFERIADKFDMKWSIRFSKQPMRLAIFVSKEDHCLYDILARYQAGEWHVEIPLIVSNHPALEHIAKKFAIPYHVFPINKENKREQEQEQLKLLGEHDIDFIILARYMQILTSDFVHEYPNRIINIHHSFLPAFAGAKPYHQAYGRGVKIIGATSHYVTADLDAGPIIEQDVMRVDHRDSIKNLIRKGKDLEKLVLSKAIWHHLQHHVLVYNNKTVILGSS